MDIFMESGDCDLELGRESRGRELTAGDFPTADLPSGIEDRGRSGRFNSR